MATWIRAAGAVLLALALCALPASSLMYEDEQGKKDWLWQGLGEVTDAFFHPASKALKSIYTLSNGNTIASLKSRSGGELRWKRVFGEGERLRGIQASDAMVVVGSVSGKVVHYLQPKDGIISFSTGLPIEGNGVDLALGLEQDTVTVAFLHTGAEADSQLTLSVLRGPAEEPFGKDALVEAIPLPGSSAQLSVTVSFDPEDASTIHVLLGATGTESRKQLSLNLKKVQSGFSETAVGVIRPTAKCVDGQLQVQDKPVALPCVTLPVEAPQVLATHPESKKGMEVIVRTTDGHIHYVVDGAVIWTRQEGLSGLQLVSFAELPKETSAAQKPFLRDTFGFQQQIVGLSKSSFGRVYSFLTGEKGETRWSFDVKGHLWSQHRSLFQGDTAPVAYTPLMIEAHADGIKVGIRVNNAAVFLDLDAVKGTLKKSSEVLQLVNLVGGRIPVVKRGSSLVAADGAVGDDIRYYTANEETGQVDGYFIRQGTEEAVKVWTFHLGHKIVSIGRPDPKAVQTADSIRVFPNTTSKQLEVRPKYAQMANLVVLAHFQEVEDEPPILHLTAIDTVTGSVLATVRHPNVDGKVHLVIAEHLVLYHIVNVKSMRYYVGTWELFERTDFTVTDSTLTNPAQIAVSAFAKQRVTTAFSTRQPLVATQLLGFPQDIQALSVTVTLDGIARKQALFVTATGQLAAVEIKALTFGFQEDGRPDPLTAPPTQVVIPGVMVLSYFHSLHGTRAIVTSPTNLESTTHVLVVGQDLFYVRTAAGKPFDVLNEDFGYQSLLMVCAGLVVVTFVVRYFAQRKSLRLQWT
jgi:hypothetical protein